jgi:hypothetical protein
VLRLPSLAPVAHSCQSRSKPYCDCLALASSILQKLSSVESSLPIIYHGMPVSYYRALLALKDGRSVTALVEKLERAPNLKALRDKDFAVLLPTGRIASDAGDEPVEPEGPPLLALEWVPDPPQSDVARTGGLCFVEVCESLLGEARGVCLGGWPTGVGGFVCLCGASKGKCCP